MRLIAIDPKSVKAWYRRGEARYQMKFVDEARDDLVEAMQLAPKDEQIRSLYEKAKKAVIEGADSQYWMQNFDFASGMFKQTAESDLSAGVRFFRAASKGDISAVRTLAAVGCDCNERVNSYTALMSAASKGLAEMVAELISMPSVLLTERTDDGSSSLHLASADGHLAVVKVLCAALDAQGAEGVLLTDRGINALMVAAFSGRLPVVAYLASLPAYAVEATDAEGLTCLHHAASAGRSAGS